ncbi:MAG: UDP-N-acetylmuramoyl-tripeptide--D-alanyl-D-alanine ligase [Muribaculaceae bacterium]|nr:UDP-N-acetylmuramoyl-tripeptide--D-alanyl-D-alanine ligase [Muribaculaceae bacterium]MDE6462863.1 UDP-N-acetylmuramoyl-tripeptide--D-alanyl-D-alanine ligase [Muribaculaceae bacterium]
MNPTIIELSIAVVSLALLAWAMVLRFSRALMMLQQNSYRNDRYMRYLKQSGDTTSFTTLGFMAFFLVGCVRAVPDVAGLAGGALMSLITIVSLSRKKYKKPLVWTRRVWRIFSVMCVITLLVTALFVVTNAWPGRIMSALLVTALLLMQACAWPEDLAMVANWLLKPVEKRINRGYVDDAARILKSMPQLKVVGITGSYGKTSTKHYLTRILSEQFSVCMTPGSFNTTMGVVRTVREHLKPFDEVFVVEMGAKQPGDIKEICDLVHPQVGVVTAVGEQHLESFKSIENVQRTKFELIDALPATGLAVINDDFPYVASREVTNVRADRYGIEFRQELSYWVKNLRYSPSGTEFTLCGADGSRMDLRTRLVGECNVSNLVGAIAVALHLGVPTEKIRHAVERIEQVEHRLSIKRTPGGLTIIDDAFNSNPHGSSMALDVLSAMTPGKRIVITPGMIELGDKQFELNAEFGRKIAASADVAIIVGEYNREAILSGIGGDDAERQIRVLTADSFNEAQRMLASMAESGDTVLYENDLPDTFK